MTAQFAIALHNGLAKLPDQNTERDEDDCDKGIHRPCYCAGRKECHDCGTPLREDCANCSNPATHEYDGIKLCFSHWVAEERNNE